MRLTITAATAVVACILVTSSAFGGYMITQEPNPGSVLPGPYITFDEPGVPTGVVIDPYPFYETSDGAVFSSSNGSTVVDDWDTLAGVAGGAGSGNQIAGGFSVRMKFDPALTAIRFQGWADGSPSFPFGGINVLLCDNAVPECNSITAVASYSGTVPFGGAGDEWFTATADGGDTFNEVVFFNGAFNSFFSYVDNVNFEQIPEPNALGLCILAVVGLCLRRRG